MATLPIIDFSEHASDTKFVDSMTNYGFAAFRNHPLDMDLVNRIYRDWAAFFASEDKFDFALNRDTQDGYFSIQNAESAKGYAEQDFKEYYHYYPWGQCPAALKSDLVSYYDAAHLFAATLLTWVEKCAPTHVSRRFSEPLPDMIQKSDVTLLRILHYPPIEGDSNVSRAAPHEDINLLTILPAAEGPGLEILGKDGNWITVQPDPGTVMINIGDMLQEASGGHFPSTTHRVAVPNDEQRSQSRMSLPLFLHPRPEVVLSDRYTAGSYLNERLNELGVV